ncbi:MAG: hypothetical protein WBG50_28255 [Desulfomonilaceae bacterium]
MSKAGAASSVVRIVEYLFDHCRDRIKDFPIRDFYPEILVLLTNHPRGQILSRELRIETASLEVLCRAILRKIAEGHFTKSGLDPFELLPKEADNWPWDQIFSANVSSLEKNDPVLGSFECVLSLAVFGRSDSVKIYKNQLQRWCGDDHLARRIANLPGDVREAGICYFEFIRIIILEYEKMGSVGNSGGVLREAFRKICGNPDQHTSALHEFARLATRYHMQDRIVKLAEKPDTFYRDFFVAVSLVANNDGKA